MPPYRSLTMIGCGNMGGAMLRSWLRDNLFTKVCIIKPTKPDEDLLKDNRITYYESIQSAPELESYIVLAIKPQMLETVCSSMRDKIRSDSIILSIMAGKTIANISQYVPQDTSIIRLMPNTPAAIGEGANVAFCNKYVTPQQKARTMEMLNSCGQGFWVEDENLMDIVTALSGSGPAYIFYIIEALTQSATELGLPNDLAMKLARQTVIGSAALSKQEPDISAESLRKNVTSPGGTTEAALSELMDGRLKEILTDTLSAAINRAKELNI